MYMSTGGSIVAVCYLLLFPNRNRDSSPGKVRPVTIRWRNITCWLSNKSSKSVRWQLVEGEENDGKNDAVTSQEEPHQSDEPEKKEEQIELVREGEAVTEDGSKQEKVMAEEIEAKAEGNSLFVNDLYEEALSKYALALELVQEFLEPIELRSICHLNRGVCFLKLILFASSEIGIGRDTKLRKCIIDYNAKIRKNVMILNKDV